MVRSRWIGLVFGVLAMSGLARGQTTPRVPAAAGESKDRIVVVQEAGKPPQRCKILKTWTEADGTPAFQAQALDTGELMTIEETDRTAPKPGELVRSASMRIFHWGQNAPVPIGTPEPPPDAVVVGTPIDIRPKAPEPPRVAAAPAPAAQPPRKQWPSAYAQTGPAGPKVAAQPAAPPPPPPAAVLAPVAPAAPPPQKVALTPIAPTPVTVNPVKLQSLASAAAPAATLKPAEATAPPAKAGPAVAKPAPASSWFAAALKPPSATPPYAVAKQLTPAKKVETAAAQAGGRRPLWVQANAPPPPPAPTPAPMHPVAVAPAPAPPLPPQQPIAVAPKATPAAPVQPVAAAPPAATPPPPPAQIPPPPQPVAAAPKAELPHAAPRADDPLNTPDRFAKLPATGTFDSDKPAPEKKAPPKPALALQPSLPTPKNDAKTLEPAAAPPPVPAPAAVAKAAAPAPAPPNVPLGLGSVLAASSPELAPPAPQTAAPTPADVGIRADEPNAFSERRQPGTAAASANAFTAPAPAAAPPPDAVALNAFPRPQPAAPYYAPPAVAVRTPPPSGPAAPQMAVGYVVRAGYQQDSGYTFAQLSGILHDSLYPSQREWAAETLASMDWRQQPHIVDVLVEGAKNDQAPGVRAGCLHSLGRMSADTIPALEAVKALRSDADAEVRQAAEEAFGALDGPASQLGWVW